MLPLDQCLCQFLALAPMRIKTSHLCEHATGILISFGGWWVAGVFLMCVWWLRHPLLTPRTVAAPLSTVHRTSGHWKPQDTVIRSPSGSEMPSAMGFQLPLTSLILSSLFLALRGVPFWVSSLYLCVQRNVPVLMSKQGAGGCTGGGIYHVSAQPAKFSCGYFVQSTFSWI